MDGKTKLENVRVYLSDLSVTKYKTAKEVPGYINGTYAGGMVGLVDTGTELQVISSASATTVAAANARQAGLVGLVRGTLNVKTAYTDCYRIPAHRRPGWRRPRWPHLCHGLLYRGLSGGHHPGCGHPARSAERGLLSIWLHRRQLYRPRRWLHLYHRRKRRVNRVYTTTRNAMGESITAVLYDIPNTGSVTSKELSSADSRIPFPMLQVPGGGDTTPHNLHVRA